jgi:hypothetical protein
MSRLLALITPPCRDITRMMSDAMDRRLPLRKRLAIRFHRLICIWCDRYYRHLQVIHNASPDFPLHLDDVSTEELSVEAKDKIKQAVQRAAP